MDVITIDGSQGEGGGQILRTSLSVSMLQCIPIRIVNIRAGRKKPGLMRQHLMSVRAATEISSAQVKGDLLGSQELLFKPGKIKNGQYRFSIGTAGSTTLVCQTILPALLKAEGSSEIIFEGGTHNGMSPSLTYLTKSFLPFLNSLGVEFNAEVEQYGFYPVGGGYWKLKINPCETLKSIDLTAEPKWCNYAIEAIISDKLSSQIGEREIKTANRFLKAGNIQSEVTVAPSPGPGNSFHISAESHGLNAMVEVTGEKHIRAETVAKCAVKKFKDFKDTNVLVEKHLADQILLYMVMAGKGSFFTVEPTLHTKTNIAVLEKLSKKRFYVESRSSDRYLISVL